MWTRLEIKGLRSERRGKLMVYPDHRGAVINPPLFLCSS